MRSRRTRFHIFVLAALVGMLSSVAGAQERFGTITGKVTDQTGLATPGVTVTVTNNETQRSTVAVTDADGTYVVARPRSGPLQREVRAERVRRPGGAGRDRSPRRNRNGRCGAEGRRAD